MRRGAGFFVIAWLLLLAAPARADSVALLPLDGEKRLEIYGQPVAAELARSLKASGVEVVVVGAKMAVPETAKLIVDGTIKAKGQTVTLVLRIRDARDGTTLETLPPSSGALMNIDKVAADISAHVVPAVKTELEALAKKATPEVKPPDQTPPDVRPNVVDKPALPTLVVANASDGTAINGALRSALEHELPAFAARHAHALKPVDGAAFERKNEAASTVAAAGGELGISLRVLSFHIMPGKVPMAKARVQLRVIDPERGVRFDRVIVTDTIVGDRDIAEDAFAARVAREVLIIAHPHIRRAVASWQ